jgi:hypothetical protein
MRLLTTDLAKFRRNAAALMLPVSTTCKNAAILSKSWRMFAHTEHEVPRTLGSKSSNQPYSIITCK